MIIFIRTDINNKAKKLRKNDLLEREKGSTESADLAGGWMEGFIIGHNVWINHSMGKKETGDGGEAGGETEVIPGLSSLAGAAEAGQL